MTDSWGWQLIVDCFGCPERACCDLDNAYEFLEALCRELKMTKQTQPYVFKTCEVAYPGRPGLSGWVPIIESGIQLHTSSNNSFVSVDVYPSVADFGADFWPASARCHRETGVYRRQFPGV